MVIRFLLTGYHKKMLTFVLAFVLNIIIVVLLNVYSSVN